MFCYYCGASNPEEHRFCGKCGRPIIRPLGLDETERPSTTPTPAADTLKGEQHAPQQRTQPSPTGYGWGYVYAVLCAAAALVHWYKLITAATTGLPAPFDANPSAVLRVFARTLLIVWGGFLVAASFGIFRKHRYSVGIVYTFAVVTALQVLIHGIIPIELAAWFAFNVPFIIYFRNRRPLFAKSVALTASRTKPQSASGPTPQSPATGRFKLWSYYIGILTAFSLILLWAFLVFTYVGATTVDPNARLAVWVHSDFPQKLGVGLFFTILLLVFLRRDLKKKRKAAPESVGHTILSSRASGIVVVFLTIAVGTAGFVQGQKGATATSTLRAFATFQEAGATLQTIKAELPALRAGELVYASDYAEMYKRIEPQVNLWRQSVERMKNALSAIERKVLPGQVWEIITLGKEGLALDEQQLELLEAQIRLSKEMEELPQAEWHIFFNENILPLLNREYEVEKQKQLTESKLRSLIESQQGE